MPSSPRRRTRCQAGRLRPLDIDGAVAHGQRLAGYGWYAQRCPKHRRVGLARVAVVTAQDAAKAGHVMRLQRAGVPADRGV